MPPASNVPGAAEQNDLPTIPLTRLQRHNLLLRFTAEGRHRRKLYRLALEREWNSIIAPAYDQENDIPGTDALGDEEIAFDAYMFERLDRYDSDFDAKKVD